MIMAPRTGYRQPQTGGQGFARTKKVFGNVMSLIAADVVLNAQVAILRVPAGFVLTNLWGSFGDADTGATLAIAIGDAAVNNRFVASSTVMQAGGAMPALAATGLLYQFPADTDVLLTALVAAVGLGPSPTVDVRMEGYMG
jgi:hypothetical protein